MYDLQIYNFWTLDSTTPNIPNLQPTFYDLPLIGLRWAVSIVAIGEILCLSMTAVFRWPLVAINEHRWPSVSIGGNRLASKLISEQWWLSWVWKFTISTPEKAIQSLFWSISQLWQISKAVSLITLIMTSYIWPFQQFESFL